MGTVMHVEISSSFSIAKTMNIKNILGFHVLALMLQWRLFAEAGHFHQQMNEFYQEMVGERFAIDGHQNKPHGQIAQELFQLAMYLQVVTSYHPPLHKVLATIQSKYQVDMMMVGIQVNVALDNFKQRSKEQQLQTVEDLAIQFKEKLVTYEKGTIQKVLIHLMKYMNAFRSETISREVREWIDIMWDHFYPEEQRLFADKNAHNLYVHMLPEHMRHLVYNGPYGHGYIAVTNWYFLRINTIVEMTDFVNKYFIDKEKYFAVSTEFRDRSVRPRPEMMEQLLNVAAISWAVIDELTFVPYVDSDNEVETIEESNGVKYFYRVFRNLQKKDFQSLKNYKEFLKRNNYPNNHKHLFKIVKQEDDTLTVVLKEGTSRKHFLFRAFNEIRNLGSAAVGERSKEALSATIRFEDDKYVSAVYLGQISVKEKKQCHHPTCGQMKKMKKCSGCEKAYYCSPECQKADWKRHKAECRSKTVEVKTCLQVIFQDPTTNGRLTFIADSVASEIRLIGIN